MIDRAQGEYQPQLPIPPGETLAEVLTAKGMSQAELAKRTGRPTKTINEIITGKTAIIPDTALQFERVLGVPASFWNNLERQYQETKSRVREEGRMANQVAWVDRFPVKAMRKLGWLSAASSKIAAVGDLLAFFGVAGWEEWEQVWLEPTAAFRSSQVFARDDYAMAAWLRQGEREAAEQKTEPYDAERWLTTLRHIRAMTKGFCAAQVEELRERCASAGVAVVFTPELPRTRVYGATRWLQPGRALMQLSMRGRKDDQFWFSFFHEAGHIYKHGKRDMFIDGNDHTVAGDACEREADNFAKTMLLPEKEYTAFVKRSIFSKTEIVQWANTQGIAPGIVVGRLQHDGHISYTFGNELRKTVTAFIGCI